VRVPHGSGEDEGGPLARRMEVVGGRRPRRSWVAAGHRNKGGCALKRGPDCWENEVLRDPLCNLLPLISFAKGIFVKGRVFVLVFYSFQFP
jgi:hypothetical protein